MSGYPARWNSLKDVLVGLREIFASDNVDVDEVKRLLNSYKSNPKDWKQFCSWDSAKYTRNLIDAGNGKYNVIILCWSEGQGSPIHSHANAHCFVKVLDGQVMETMYQWPDSEDDEQPMRVFKKGSLFTNEVTYINDTIGLHRMENPSHTEGLVTLHVYIPGYQECTTFDERSGHRNVCKVVFHSNSGESLDYGNSRPGCSEQALPAPNEGTLELPEAHNCSSDVCPSTSAAADRSGSSSSDEDSSSHELDYSHSEMESFEITFSNFSRRDGNKIGRISLAHNRLRVVPRKISIFTNLNFLDLSGNMIDSLSPEILKLTQLRTLIAKNNRLTAEGIPKELYQLTELQHVNLSGNPLGHVPEVLSVMKNLVFLQLGSCELEEIPEILTNTPSKLEVLYLGGNRLSSVPEEIGYLDNLQALHLNGNELEALPPSIANLSQLKSLSLHQNRLSALPSEIIRLDNLRELSLRENPLVRHFVRFLIFQPPTLQEIAGRVIKGKKILYQGQLPTNLIQYLNSAHHCVNARCKGVYFDTRFEHIKFVDFCGKYKVPFLEYLCSPRCIPSSPVPLTETPDQEEADMMKKVLLG
ncbi:leucine-rich repeat-containing protein 58-like [Paramacrobiotus metropolitanus]|uniref:leucine-rich repeat-containing protein 58-like n=1 Tax=Paramacrobiotus metropolitanus TaxID=2943436 RepID=UPI002446300F|nr:leucine-rich repeat-containing protein 58-like [Paramacrobiotus metropolitanus]